MAINNMFSIDEVTAPGRISACRREEMLKDHYYRVNPSEYFERRLWGVIAIADHEKDDSRSWKRTEKSSVVSQYIALLGKEIDWDGVPGDTLGNRSMAVIESYALMQHVIETALRLFAVAKDYKAGASPVMHLVSMTSPSALREPVKRLLSPLAPQLVRDIFPKNHLSNLKGKEDRHGQVLHEQFLTKWLVLFAQFYSDDHYRGARGNNQLKHGVVATPHLDKDVVTYVETLRETGFDARHLLRSDTSDVVTNLVVSRVGISIIQSLWQLSEVIANPGVLKNYSYDWSPLPDAVFSNGGIPFSSEIKALDERISKPDTKPKKPWKKK